MLGEVLGFLEFSEQNIDWQYIMEVQSIERQAAYGGFLSDKDKDLEDEYRNHLLENAEHRFIADEGALCVFGRIHYNGRMAGPAFEGPVWDEGPKRHR